MCTYVNTHTYTVAVGSGNVRSGGCWNLPPLTQFVAQFQVIISSKPSIFFLVILSPRVAYPIWEWWNMNRLGFSKQYKVSALVPVPVLYLFVASLVCFASCYVTQAT